MRYLFAKKSHNAVNVISFISMAGVAVATAAIVCVLSVFNGFSDLAMQRLSLIDPQAKVTPLKGKTIAAADSVAQAIASLPEVDSAVPMIEEHALAMYDGTPTARPTSRRHRAYLHLCAAPHRPHQSFQPYDRLYG